MSAWPGTLPAQPLVSGYSDSLPDLVLRSNMDTGPAKTRKRFSSGVRPFRVVFEFTNTQRGYFETFFLTTIEGGALSFTWTDPRNVSRTIRIVGAPEFQPGGWGTDGAQAWRCSMAWEALP